MRTAAMRTSAPIDAKPGMSWHWPLPALMTWALAWAVHLGAKPWLGGPVAFGLGCVVGAVLAMMARGLTRRLVVGLGFPASALATGLAGDLPSWTWLLALGVLASIYPLRAWRDAPLFPTPARSLDALADAIKLAPGARVLDAGCGIGDGLQALHSAWPTARVEGVEWSRLLTWFARLRCRFAQVEHGDMWARSWSGLDVVYLFQRPESMARAWDKANAEMPAGSWLVSLDFNVPGRRADLQIATHGGRTVRAWRLDAQSGAVGADNHP